jgi:hypothetical protein
MKVMVLGKASKETEDGGVPPDPQALEAMHNYNEALMAAGILRDQVLGGLQPTRFAKRVHFSGKNRTVIDGPFAETKELVAGFWLWQVRSKEEAIEWLKRSPFQEGEVEIRQVFETADLAASDPTGELMKREEELRKTIESRRK